MDRRSSTMKQLWADPKWRARQKRRISTATRKAMQRSSVRVKLGSGSRGHRPWNWGLTKDTSTSVALYAKRMRKTVRAQYRHGRRSWNLGLSCPRDPLAARQSGATFRQRMALGLIKQAVPRRIGFHSVQHGLVWFRSKWERYFARVLDVLGFAWRYEPVAFLLPNGRNYTPDFYVEIPKKFWWLFKCQATFVEIKGHWYPGAKAKVDLFKATYPLHLHVVDADVMKQFGTVRKLLIKDGIVPSVKAC